MSEADPGPCALPRENAFDALRLLAAFAVVGQHATGHLHLPFLWDPGDGSRWFHDGVPLFFILSGLLVGRSARLARLAGRPWGDFFRNRALRVAPLIWAYFLVAALALGFTGHLGWALTQPLQGLMWAASHLLLVPVFTPEALRGLGVGALNGSLWTIPAECSFYLLCPLLAIAGGRWGPARVAWACVAVGVLSEGLLAWGLAQAPGGLPWKLLQITCLPYLGAFGLGLAWGCGPAERLPGGWKALALATLGLLAFWWLRPLAAPHPALAGLVALAWTLPLSLAAMAIGLHAPAWVHGATKRLGDLSYGTYVWHMPVMTLLIEWAKPERPAGPWPVPLLILGVFALAYASWHGLEKRCLAAKRSSSLAAR